MERGIPWNKGKKGAQVSWNKTPLEKEKEAINLYKSGFSIQKTALKMEFSRDTVWRILKRNNIHARMFGTYERTDEHRAIAKDTLGRTTNKMRSEGTFEQHQKKAGKQRGLQLKIDKEHQSKAGKLGGLKTKEVQKLHPEILYPFLEAGKNNNPILLKWKEEHPEENHKISSETAKRTHQKDPSLASWMGLKSIESKRKKKRFYWEDVPFASKEEMEVAKLLLNKPIKGVNTHIRLQLTNKGWKEIDFYLQNKVFVEYHPNGYNDNLKRCQSTKEYMKLRIDAVKNSKYKGTYIEFVFDQLSRNKAKVLERIKEIKEKYNIN